MAPACFARSKELVMRQLVSRFIRDERGMETVEWGVLAALIVAGLVGVIAGLGANVKAKFTNLQNQTT
jgi:Flp pilus assembly pilin Flp